MTSALDPSADGAVPSALDPGAVPEPRSGSDVPRSAPLTPATGTGTASRNVDGAAIAITVFSTIRFWGRPFLPLLFGVTRRIPPLTGTLRKLSFIHFARWSLVRTLPYNGPPQRPGPLRYPHMYFESNFNGGWEEYIDAFSHILAPGMSAFWGSSYGFPMPLPTGPFKAYIQANEYEADHYWSACPAATSTMVQRALELEPRLAAFVADAARMSPQQFVPAYRAFLTDIQRCL
jgi:hypothetical protein